MDRTCSVSPLEHQGTGLGEAHVSGCHRGGCESGLPWAGAGRACGCKGSGPVLAHGALVEMALHTVGLRLLHGGRPELSEPEAVTLGGPAAVHPREKGP